MSVALAGHSPTTFEIKSAQLRLLTLRLKSPALDVLAEELTAQYGERPGFFEQDLLVIDLAPLQTLPCLQAGDERQAPAQEPPPAADAPPIDFDRLQALLRQHGLRPLAVCGGSPAQMAAAEAAGLPAAADMQGCAAAARPEPLPPAEAAALPPPGALILDRPLRSGQQAYARGRDLVVMAMVNPGAEVIADGHIHVYAPLRGRAIAGARGWADARIFAREMRPELVSIAGVWRICEEPLPATIWGQAATLRLQSGEAGDKLVFEPVAG